MRATVIRNLYVHGGLQRRRHRCRRPDRCANNKLSIYIYRISVEHITRDINNEWLIRYMHANGASFRIIVYIHIFKGFLCSWMGAGILKVPAKRSQEAAALVQSGSNDVQSVIRQLEME